MKNWKAAETTQPVSSIRVVLFIGSLSMGGAERQFIELAKGLNDRGFDIEVMLNSSGGPFQTELKDAGIPFAVLHLGSVWALPLYLFRALSALRRFRPHIVYGFMGSGMKSTIFNFFVRDYKTIWGVRSSNIEPMQNSLSLKFAGWLDRILSRFADAIIYNSHAGMIDRLAKGWADQDSHVVANGVDFERFKPHSHLRAEMRERWSIKPEQVVLGMLARQDPMKDHKNLISALALLADPTVVLVLTCERDGPMSTLLQSHASALGVTDQLLYVGHSTPPEQLLNMLDIYVQSSLYGEGFPNAIGEAMSVGLPVVATDVGDCKRIIGKHGKIVPASDSESLAAALRFTIDKLPHKSGSDSRQRIIDNYSIDAMVSHTLDVFSKVMKK